MPMLRMLALLTLAALSLFTVFLLKLAWAQRTGAQQVRTAR